MNQPKSKKIWKRLTRIFLKSILFILLFIVFLVILLLTPPVQNLIRKKAVTYLEKKLDTKVRIGELSFGLSGTVALKDFYIEDRKKDTLVSGSLAKVNLSLFSLLFKNKVNIRSVQLEDITARIKRELPDTTFNYKFIADAFGSSDTPDQPGKKKSSGFSIHKITLNRINAIYKDVLTGNDLQTRIGYLDTRIDGIDLSASSITIAGTKIKNMQATINQSSPLVNPATPSSTGESASAAPHLYIGDLSLEEINLEYDNDISLLHNKTHIGTLLLEKGQLDLDRQIIDVNSFSLQNSVASLQLGKTTKQPVAASTVKDTISQAGQTWQVHVNSFVADNNHLRFDNNNLPVQREGMDYAHLYASPFSLHLADFRLSHDTISGKIEKAVFKEQCGFELQALAAEFFYSDNQAYLHNLYLQTAGTAIKKAASIKYSSPEVFTKDIGSLMINLDIENSHILVRDILVFAPSLRTSPALADPSVTWHINSAVHGSIADLHIDDLKLSGLQDTKVDIKGRITGLPAMEKWQANLSINKISSSKRDIHRFMPSVTLPETINWPKRMTLSGNAAGNIQSFSSQLNLTTDIGDASVKVRASHLDQTLAARYNADIKTSSFDLGSLLGDTVNLGPVSSSFTISGRGTEWKTASVALDGTIRSALFRQYNYQDLKLTGNLDEQLATIKAAIKDPNLYLTVDASADLNGEYPTLKMTAIVDSIKTEPLHLTPNAIIYRGKIEAEFTSLNPSSPQGELYITKSLLIENEKRLQLDTLEIIATRSDSSNLITLRSDIAYAQLEGQYRLDQLGNIIQESIQPYFSLQTPRQNPSATEPYDFRFDASVLNSQPLQAFMPSLKRMDSLKLQSHFSANAGWDLAIEAPAIDYGTNRIRDMKFNASSGDSAIDANLIVKQISSGNIDLFNSSISAKLSNNKLDFTTNIKDPGNRTRYLFSGRINQAQTGQYIISLSPDDLVLNYQRWNIPSTNSILLEKENIRASDFTLGRGDEQLNISSIEENDPSPLEMHFDDFRLSTITAFIQNDSTLVDGKMNGRITFMDILNDPIFKGELELTDVSVRNDTVGNAHISISSTDPNNYSGQLTLSGRGNDLQVEGTYHAGGNNSSQYDLNLDINRLPLLTVQAFSDGAIKSASGSLHGKFHISGTFQKPAITGDLNFDKTGFNFSKLNSYFTIDQEKLSVDKAGIHFNGFRVKDSLNNSLILDGIAKTSNFRNYEFDFTIRASNFRALNSTRKDNDLFYGQLFFNSNLSVKGTEQAPVVDGRITVNEKTKMTVVLPQRDPGIVERTGVVEFIDKDAPLNDSLFLTPYDSLNTSSIRGVAISTNIEVDKNAEFTLIIDEGNGDFLNVKGEASLTSGIDPSGKLTLAGSYEIEEGAYELTFNFIKRKFNIQKGSKITWLGEPTNANLDITANYIANTSPLDLVKDQLGTDVSVTQRNTYLQKIPFEVILKMQGKLLQPEISFDIRLPENKTYEVSNDILSHVRTKLSLLRQEPGELNKQVFALLLLNRFIGDNPFYTSSQSISASTLARQSVSKLLTEQLNRLAEDLIEGVDLNFDITSSEDYTTGERKDRTDLNVGLSRQLLNDRLTVTIGSNFELEGPQNANRKASNIAGNVALNYRLSKDGRYMLRAYRKNEYEGIIDGYIVETGVSFIISLDYNKFSQIFRNKEQRRKRREIRRAERDRERKEANELIREEQ